MPFWSSMYPSMRSVLPYLFLFVSLCSSQRGILQGQSIFSNPRSDSSHYLHIPSVHESAVQARRILQISNIATLSTMFPEPPSTLERRPSDVGNTAVGLMEYYAQCGPEFYNPTILGVTIATTMKNAAAGSNVTLSLRYHVPADAPPSDDPWAYLPANLPRFALIGYIEKLAKEQIKEHNIRNCFIQSHPEATIWEPGTDIHESWWGRLVVQEVYFFGGFGDRARIGWSIRPFYLCPGLHTQGGFRSRSGEVLLRRKWTNIG